MPEHVEGGQCRCWGCIQYFEEESALTQEVVVSQERQFERAMCWRLRDQLLDSTPEWLEVEGEGTRLGVQKPLLLELQEQVKPSGECGSGGSGFGPGSPVAVAALALMQDIEREMDEQMWLLPRPDPEGRPKKLAQRIRYWVDCLNSRPDLIQECYRVLGGWVKQIQELFDPPTIVRLRRACPACHSTHAWEQRDGEMVRDRALVAVIRPESYPVVEIACRECGAGWQGADIHTLEGLTRDREE